MEGYLPIYTKYKNFSKGSRCHLRKHHAKNKRNPFRLEKRNADAHKAEDGYTQLLLFPSVKNLNEKYHQEIQRQPHITGQACQRQEEQDFKDADRKLVRNVQM